MNAVFADSAFWIALADASDRLHEKALSEYGRVRRERLSVVTHWGVLSEVVAVLSSRRRMPRPQLIRYMQEVRHDHQVTVLYLEQSLVEEAWQLLERRPDKEWSLVDCASFVLMRRRELTDALTYDQHFQQAGFQALLR